MVDAIISAYQRYQRNRMRMQYSLYTLYKNSSLNLYQIRKHYIEHFYYRKHSRNEVENVLRTITNSSKVDKLIKKSVHKRNVPSHDDFLSTICSMLKFLFKSSETTALATLDAALRWDIEVNSLLELISPEELKDEMIKVFQKLSIYEEMSEKEFHSLESISTVDAEIVEQSTEHPQLESKIDPNQTTWNLVAFVHQFGKMHVGEFARKSDGELFYSCIFTDDNGKKTFVGFSSKLGVLTPEEIERMKNDLVVIKSPSGNYNLYKAKKKGGWEEVNI